MALELKPFLNFSINTGQTTNVLDYSGLYDPVLNLTGYGFPNIDISAVTCTRNIFSSYLTEINASSSVAIVAGTEYTVGGIGTFSYDTKTYTTGDIFISMLSGTPTLSNCTLTQTGRFSSASSFLPSQIISSDLTPSLSVGINDLIYPDSSYFLEYSIYTTKKISGDTPAAGVYIVGGTSGQTITWNGITYRINEVFTVSGSHVLSGTGFIALFYATATCDQQLSYYANQSQIEYELKVAQAGCGCKDNLKDALITISTDYAAIQDYFEGNIGTDFTGTQILFDEIASVAANPKLRKVK